MRVQFVIVIWVVVILGMVAEANFMGGVHAEYRRQRWAQGQSPAVKIYPEIPAGVHAEYMRRRRIERQPATVKIHAPQHRRPPAPQHRRVPIPHVRPPAPHLRQRRVGNTYV